MIGERWCITDEAGEVHPVTGLFDGDGVETDSLDLAEIIVVHMRDTWVVMRMNAAALVEVVQ